jgi:hypothetical protein
MLNYKSGFKQRTIIPSEFFEFFKITQKSRNHKFKEIPNHCLKHILEFVLPEKKFEL